MAKIPLCVWSKVVPEVGGCGMAGSQHIDDVMGWHEDFTWGVVQNVESCV